MYSYNMEIQHIQKQDQYKSRYGQNASGQEAGDKDARFVHWHFVRWDFVLDSYKLSKERRKEKRHNELCFKQNHIWNVPLFSPKWVAFV